MRSLLRTMILLGILASAVGSQVEKKPRAYIFVEFTTATSSNIAFVMKPFYAVLRNEDSQGYIINYGGPKAIRARRAVIMKGINWREDYDQPRVTFVDGPFEKSARTVMWVVPAGADYPTP